MNKNLLRIGYSVGYWTIIEEVELPIDKTDNLVCQCRCGHIKSIKVSRFIRYDDNSSCEECRVKNRRSHVQVIVGEKYGDWEVICDKITKHEKFAQYYVFCRCKCGNEHHVLFHKLKNGVANHCYECGHTKHGLSHHRIKTIFQGMFQRCTNPNSSKYHLYGGANINICDEWMYNLQGFYDWSMTNGYQDGLTIDRIDSTKGYSPDNCRWISKKEQSYNRRGVLSRKTTSKYKGVSLNSRNKKPWCSEIHKDGVKYYLGAFSTEEEAALSYNIKAKELFGEHAYLNIIEGE